VKFNFWVHAEFTALEQTVVGTAIPIFVGELKGFKIFAWVTPANMITATIVIPVSGKLSGFLICFWNRNFPNCKPNTRQ
jgi:hypothetical protein